jgi:hypothetical protein
MHFGHIHFCKDLREWPSEINCQFFLCQRENVCILKGISKLKLWCGHEDEGLEEFVNLQDATFDVIKDELG